MNGRREEEKPLQQPSSGMLLYLPGLNPEPPSPPPEAAQGGGGSRGGGALLRLTLLGSPASSARVCVGKRRRSSPCIINEGGLPLRRSALQPELFLPPTWKFERELM